MGRIARDPLDRYLEKIDVRSPDECWEWTAACFSNGYGAFRLGERQVRAHRFGYEALVEPIPDRLIICHTCDNPPCQNLDHLFVGTTKDNAVDRELKGRRSLHVPPPTSRPGESNPAVKLTAELVTQIRLRKAAGESQVRLAEEFGVSTANVSLIVNRKLWDHIA